MNIGHLLISLVMVCSLNMNAAEPLFFAFDNGVARGASTPEQQAAWLKDIGYGGIGYTGYGQLAERQRVFDAAGLVITSLYVGENLDHKQTHHAERDAALPLLKDRSTVLWFTVQGKGTDDEVDAVIRETSTAAAAHNVQVVLYPHFGFRIATAEQALAVVQRLGLTNLGLTFNLCHELRAGNQTRLADIIRASAKHLRMVSLNGANPGTEWSDLIKPLGEGSVDVLGVLRTLREVGYAGPIGLQCFQVPGDQRENLRKSLVAWRGYQKALATP